MGLPLHDVYILAAVEDRRDENAAPQLGGTMQRVKGGSGRSLAISPLLPQCQTFGGAALHLNSNGKSFKMPSGLQPKQLGSFGDDDTGHAREQLAFVFAPTGLPQPVVRFLLAVSLPLAGHYQKFPRHESGGCGFGVRWVHPEVY